MKTILAAVVSVAALSVPALAQDYSAPPTYGSVNLNSGFTPDPYNVRLTSGGARPASNVSSSCRGWIANAPDYSVYYQAGNMFDLTIGAVSDSDTTLVVNGPSGNWYCDDDSGEGLNPSLTFANPASGRYDIWVGSYREGNYADATLSISELGLAGGSASGGEHRLVASGQFRQRQPERRFHPGPVSRGHHFGRLTSGVRSAFGLCWLGVCGSGFRAELHGRFLAADPVGQFLLGHDHSGE